uniref:Uncharacterized mitochondrial protein AtMg00810-like n=1 Tax=Nicotiana tabacum TaxID=4097 RepID=A0A1S4APA8_TOBAC|nr:PREDICTED: uncharacterized mitochondrial protein AtMg00810-like [Nicotiana tabacum]
MHGDLFEELYMKVPLGLIVSSSSSGPPFICKLKKSLYDLKQASWQWFAKLSHALIFRGYSFSLNGYSLFTKFTSSSTILIDVYVDDILLVRNDDSELTSLKAFLDQQFKIKDLEVVHYFLGLEVSHLLHVQLVNQHKYLKELLSVFHCSSASPVVTPLDLSVKLTPTYGDALVDPSPYRRLIGKLNFLQHTRHDISFSVQHLSQFLNTPRIAHMHAALHVLRYLVKDPGRGIFFNRTQDFSLQAFSNSDWAGGPSSRKSVSGYLVTLGGSPVCWKFSEEGGTFGDIQSTVVRTQIDYLLLRRCNRGLCTDCKVIPSENLSTQHRLLVMDLEIGRKRKKRIEFGLPKIKWGALTKNTTRVLVEKLEAMGGMEE